MNTLLTRPTCAMLATALALLAPAIGHSSSSMAFNGQSASASVEIRIVVLPSVRILGDSHPQQLVASLGQPIEALQKLTISTNVPRGFCLQLQSTQGAQAGWRLQQLEGDDVSIAPSQGGYRVCGGRNGTYNLVLKHGFSAPDSNLAMAWPVRTELHTL
jgi:hypothetical protein